MSCNSSSYDESVSKALRLVNRDFGDGGLRLDGNMKGASAENQLKPTIKIKKLHFIKDGSKIKAAASLPRYWNGQAEAEKLKANKVMQLLTKSIQVKEPES